MNKKIEPPEQGTKADEGWRIGIDAAISGIPFVGGPLAIMTRWVVPSKRDIKTTEWRADVSEAVNDHGSRLLAVEEDVVALQANVDGLHSAVSGLSGQMVDLSVPSLRASAGVDPYDGGLKMCSRLIERGKPQTAFDALEARLADHDEERDDALTARIVSAQGTCKLRMGKPEEAARLFLHAYARSPEPLRVRQNAAVGHHIEGRNKEAMQLLRELLAENPSDAALWANLILVRECVDGPDGPLEGVPSQLHRHEDVMCVAVSVLRNRGGNGWHDMAEEARRAHPEAHRTRRAAAEAALDRAVAVRVADAPDPHALSRAIAEAREASKVLAELWGAFAATEVDAGAVDPSLLLNTLTGFRLADELPRVLALVDANIDALVVDPDGRAAVAAIGLEAGRDDLFDRAVLEPFKGRAAMVLERAVRRREWHDALHILETDEEELNAGTERPPAQGAEVLRAVCAPEDERSGALEAVLSADRLDAHSTLFLSRVARACGAEIVADVALRRAVEMAPDRRALRLQVAFEAALRNWYSEVIDLLDGHVDPTRDAPERVQLAIAHASVKPVRQSGIAFFQALGPHAREDATLQLCSGHYHLARGKEKEALAWLRRAAKLEPHAARIILVLWQALARVDRKEEADALLRDVGLDTIEGEVTERLGLAQLLWQKGRLDALDYGYEIASTHRDDASICLSFFGFVLADSMIPSAPSIPVPRSVDRNVWVRLTRSDGSVMEFVVAEANDTGRCHLAHDHPIVAAAIGHTVGDTFEAGQGPGHAKWTVAEIKHRASYLFHVLSANFENRFPDQRSFWSMRMTDNDVEPILEQVRARERFVDRVMRAYDEDHLPLGIVAGMCGTTAFSFAHELGARGRTVHASTGMAAEQDGERAVLAAGVTKRPLVLDTYTALLLDDLGLLNVVSAAFRRVLLPSSAMNELNAHAETFERTSNEPTFSLSSEGGQIVRIEQRPEDAAAAFQRMTDLVGRLQAAIEVAGTEMPDVAHRQLDGLLDHLGPQFDTLSVALREDGIILTADLWLRHFARQRCEIDVCGLGPVLRRLVDAKVIGWDQYARATAKMMALGHSNVAISARLLREILLLEEELGADAFDRAAACFGSPGADASSHIGVSSAFANLAFETLPPLRAMRATGTLLRSLIRLNDADPWALLSQMSQFAESYLLVDYYKAWGRGHLFGITPQKNGSSVDQA